MGNIINFDKTGVKNSEKSNVVQINTNFTVSETTCQTRNSHNDESR